MTRTSNVAVCSFANNTKIMKLIEKPQDINILQEYNLLSWLILCDKLKFLRYGKSIIDIYKKRKCTTTNWKIKPEKCVRELSVIVTPEAIKIIKLRLLNVKQLWARYGEAFTR